MKKSKKIIIMLIIIVILLTIGASMYAYFTYQTGIENTISLGYNKVTVNEEYNPPANLKDEIAKGNVTYTKKPSVTNTGNVNCYVRVKSELSDSRVNAEIDYDSSEDVNDDTKNWYYSNEDGYYYYKKELVPGESTEPLFTKVTINTSEDNSIVLEGFDIYVYAESVQTLEGKSMTEAWEYFSERS